ncbi:hypothetical protein D3C85_1422080 [compost metagenome]
MAGRRPRAAAGLAFRYLAHQHLQHEAGPLLHLALAAGDAQVPPQAWAQRAHADTRIMLRRCRFMGQQGGAIARGYQAFHRIVVIELDARRRLQAGAGKPVAGDP